MKIPSGDEKGSHLLGKMERLGNSDSFFVVVKQILVSVGFVTALLMAMADRQLDQRWLSLQTHLEVTFSLTSLEGK